MTVFVQRRVVFPTGQSRRNAFSLVEVIVAIGIMTFCIISLMGLFSVGLKAGRQSTNETEMSALAFQMAGEMSASTAIYNPRSTATYTGTNGIYFYTITGEQVPASQLTGIYTNLYRAKITFTWPVDAPAAKRQTNLFYVSLPPP